jgi:hypothetical protein
LDIFAGQDGFEYVPEICIRRDACFHCFLPRRSVVEIFTSQGCSSCPPADRAFSAATGGSVLGLAWHVDYWDYLGWRDTFSSAQATSRQAAYSFGSYTPEIIVNGSRVVANSDSSSAIASALSASLPVRVSVSGSSVNIGAGSGHADIVLVRYVKSASVAIRRGENSGATVVYKHPVIGSRKIGAWNGAAVSVNVSRAECGGACAVLLQVGVGRILGAATL